jgi:hypothetical protein
MLNLITVVCFQMSDKKVRAFEREDFVCLDNFFKRHWTNGSSIDVVPRALSRRDAGLRSTTESRFTSLSEKIEEHVQSLPVLTIHAFSRSLKPNHPIFRSPSQYYSRFKRKLSRKLPSRLNLLPSPQHIHFPRHRKNDPVNSNPETNITVFSDTRSSSTASYTA